MRLLGSAEFKVNEGRFLDNFKATELDSKRKVIYRDRTQNLKLAS